MTATLRDAKYAALLDLTGASAGTTNDLENLWLAGLTSNTGYTSALYDEWLTGLGYTSGMVKDRLYALMGDQGYTGTLNDRLYQFWAAGGTLAGGGFNAPSDLVATAISDTEIDLTWTDNSADETGFRVERSPNGSTGWTEVTTTAANATSYSNTGLTAETTYYYRVIAEGDGGESSPSNVANDTTDAAPETDFIFTVTTTTPGETFTIPCQNVGTFNAVIDWGDAGPTSAITAYNDADLAHVYASAGDHQIRISGNFPNIYFNSGGDKLKVISVENLGVVGWTRLDRAFSGCSNMTSFTAGNCDTSSVTNMTNMFNGCSSLTSLDVSGFDTSIVTNMAYMFQSCSSLTSLDVSGFDTSIVTNMAYMFRDCSNLTSLDVSGLAIPLVTNMTNMFLNSNNWLDAQYDAALISFAGQAPNIQSNVIFHAGDAKYSSGAAAAARLLLTGTYSWTITDGGAA